MTTLNCKKLILVIVLPSFDHGADYIAVHKARCLMDLETSLSEVIKAFYKNNAMLIPKTNGALGSDPRKIGSVLEYYGMSYEMVEQNGWTRSGLYIVSYWTKDSIHQIHTIAVKYIGSRYIPYNSGSFSTPDALGSLYICGYYLGE